MGSHASITWKSMREEHGGSGRLGGCPGREGGPGMLSTISGDIDPQRAGARRRFPARTLHLVDIENLAGTGLPAEWEVAGVRQEYGTRVGVGPIDQVVIGCNHKALPATGHGWPGARYLVRSGPDGADTELL